MREILGRPVPASHGMSIGDQIFRPNASDNSQPQDRDIHRIPFHLSYTYITAQDDLSTEATSSGCILHITRE
jgi:hypothetical protein